MSKYLTYKERLEIQQGLKNQLSFGKIAISIGKDRTTVVKEIKKYALNRRLDILHILTMLVFTEKIVTRKTSVH